MKNAGTAARIVAASIAFLAWAGLVVQVLALSPHNSFFQVLWIISAFFTITTNLLVAVVFTEIALARTALTSPSILAGTTLSILLVGVIYGLLLHGSTELSGGSAVANVLMHMVTPVLVPLFWIAFAPRGRLVWRDPLLWALYPLAYLAYALLRGAFTAKYPYPFINVVALGWSRTALNAALIAVAFLLSGFAIVGIDRRLGSHNSATHPPSGPGRTK